MCLLLLPLLCILSVPSCLSPVLFCICLYLVLICVFSPVCICLISEPVISEILSSIFLFYVPSIYNPHLSSCSHCDLFIFFWCSISIEVISDDEAWPELIILLSPSLWIFFCLFLFLIHTQSSLCFFLRLEQEPPQIFSF